MQEFRSLNEHARLYEAAYRNNPHMKKRRGDRKSRYHTKAPEFVLQLELEHAAAAWLGNAHQLAQGSAAGCAVHV
jgi:hypothetical protein